MIASIYDIMVQIKQFVNPIAKSMLLYTAMKKKWTEKLISGSSNVAYPEANHLTLEENVTGRISYEKIYGTFSQLTSPCFPVKPNKFIFYLFDFVFKHPNGLIMLLPTTR